MTVVVCGQSATIQAEVRDYNSQYEAVREANEILDEKLAALKLTLGEAA